MGRALRRSSSHDVRMIQSEHVLPFENDRSLFVIFDQFGFIDRFQGEIVVGRLMIGEKNRSVTALTQRFQQMERIESQTLINFQRLTETTMESFDVQLPSVQIGLQRFVARSQRRSKRIA